MFNPVHGIPSGPHDRKGTYINSNSVRRGYHNEAEARYSDTAYKRCKQCGFICNTERDLRNADGNGTNLDTTYGGTAAVAGVSSGTPIGLLLVITGASTGTDADPAGIEPIVNSGCPLCGSFNY